MNDFLMLYHLTCQHLEDLRSQVIQDFINDQCRKFQNHTLGKTICSKGQIDQRMLI